jgi:hypothetical protein
MRILNTRRKPDNPTCIDAGELRRLMEEALRDPDGPIIIINVPIEIDSDGNIILKRN